MKTALVFCLIAALVLAPSEAYAQRGHGGGGGGARGGGGGWQGGGGGWQGGGGQRGGFQGQGGGRTASNGPAQRGPGNRGPSPAQHQFAHQPAHAFSHRPAYHGNWYHGDWHGHWAHPWAYRPWGWYGGGWGWGFGFGVGVASVGFVTLGSPWGWGYYNYWNPYWVAPVGGVTYIDYSQPIVIAPPPATVAPQPGVQLPGPSADVGAAPSTFAASGAAPNSAQERGLAAFDTARNLFKRGDYDMALAQTNKAAALLPNDSLIHEFRALCLFAKQDYQQAAGAMYAVLTVGPGWDSATVSGLYPNASVYGGQLRTLENYCSDHPEAASARFLLAYHYMLGGRSEQAASELKAVVELEPNDQLSAQLLKGLTTGPQEQPAAEPPAESDQPVDAAALVGNWKASRTDGSSFELKLTKDHKFNWNCTQQDKKQQLKGTYTFADNYLILTAGGKNTLVGQVAMESPDTLQFKLAGGSPADPGLTFTR